MKTNKSSTKRMTFVFLMDPLETVKYHKDTTLALMLGAQERGHDVYFLPMGGLTLRQEKAIFHATRVVPQRNPDKPFVIKQLVNLTAEKVDAVFVRTDPPFDNQYLLQTWMLDRLPPRIVVVNRPYGIRTVNEKLWNSRFSSLVPPTLISRNKSEMLRFLKMQKDIIVKPTDGHGGRAVFRLKVGDTNTHVIFETVSRNFTGEIILQKYIPAAAKGDKRILLLGGEPLGAVLRVHAADDHRNNIFAGGKTLPATITRRDQHIIDSLKPHLRDLGLYFVGIDILGDYLTEVNVTSPTCLQEMGRFQKQKMELKVIQFVENLVNDRS